MAAKSFNLTSWFDEQGYPVSLQVSLWGTAAELLDLKDVIEDRWKVLDEEQEGLFWRMPDSHTAHLEVEATELSQYLDYWLPDEPYWALVQGRAF